jgi:hypothetical protein
MRIAGATPVGVQMETVPKTSDNFVVFPVRCALGVGKWPSAVDEILG